MKALEVHINGHRVCLAGVGKDGVLNAIINCISNPDQDHEIFLHVGGLDSATDEHLRWAVPSIGVGAEILVRIVDTSTVDPPEKRYRTERPATIDQYRECLSEFSEQLTEHERQKLIRELVADLEKK